MTEKQKQAILVLNGLTGYLSHEEYFTLLEFVVEQPQQVCNPSPWTITPYIPDFGKVTCEDGKTEFSSLTDNANKHEGEYNPNDCLMGDSKPKKELSYGDKLIMENKSPI